MLPFDRRLSVLNQTMKSSSTFDNISIGLTKSKNGITFQIQNKNKIEQYNQL